MQRRGAPSEHHVPHRGPARWWPALLALAALGVPGLTGAASAQQHDAPPAVTGTDAAVRRFDIPAQPLEDALAAFDIATGIEVFADGASVAGRRSSAVTGSYAPLDALHALLAGSGSRSWGRAARCWSAAPARRPSSPPSRGARS